MMGNTASLKKEYAERIAPALMKQFNYSSAMQVPVLKKIVINEVNVVKMYYIRWITVKTR